MVRRGSLQLDLPASLVEASDLHSRVAQYEQRLESLWDVLTQARRECAQLREEQLSQSPPVGGTILEGTV